MGLIPTTVDGPHEAPVCIITTVLLPLRNTRNSPEVPAATHALAASKAAARTDANVNTMITRTGPLPLRNTQVNPEVPTITHVPVTSKAATRIDANVDAKINERITP